MYHKSRSFDCARSDRIPQSFAAEGDRTMKWGRDYDYHGSRNYGANAPVTGRFSLMFHWIANVVRNRMRKLIGRGSPTAFLLSDGKHNFSMLGVSAKHPSPGRQAANSPGDRAANLNARDWRVLP
jgi:hypothetical protein